MSVEPNEIWHRRLSHVHYRALPHVSKVVEGLPEIQAKHDGVCKGCAKGKNTKKTFPSSESKAKGILEIIHSDVCGPMSSSSLSGYAYYVYFIVFLRRPILDPKIPLMTEHYVLQAKLSKVF